MTLMTSFAQTARDIAVMAGHACHGRRRSRAVSLRPGERHVRCLARQPNIQQPNEIELRGEEHMRRFIFAIVCVVSALTSVSGCERSPEQARALVEVQRASWARELGGIKEQHAILATRFQQQAAGADTSPAARRLRAVLDGARQSLVDVQNQLEQAATRMEQAARRNDQAGARVLDEESVRAREYLQSLREQLTAATQQFEEFSRSETEAKEASL
jgi:hypothetical protein